MSDPRPVVLGPRDPPRGVRVVTTTRRGGLATGPWATLALGSSESPEAATRANRSRLVRGLGLPGEPTWLRQAHGCECVALDGREPVDGIEADAAWTETPGVVCAVLTADCLPVALFDRSARGVAVAHAGWRGLAAGVLENAVAALPGPAGEVVAWLGPAIGPSAFEVGPEVREAFVTADPGAAAAFRPGRDDRWFGDLYALARRRLRAIGVARTRGGGTCTFSEPARFFSHRRDGAGTGRMATLAWIEPTPA